MGLFRLEGLNISSLSHKKTERQGGSAQNASVEKPSKQAGEEDVNKALAKLQKGEGSAASSALLDDDRLERAQAILSAQGGGMSAASRGAALVPDHEIFLEHVTAEVKKSQRKSVKDLKGEQFWFARDAKMGTALAQQRQ